MKESRIGRIIKAKEKEISSYYHGYHLVVADASDIYPNNKNSHMFRLIHLNTGRQEFFNNPIPFEEIDYDS